jgi:cytochrome c
MRWIFAIAAAGLLAGCGGGSQAPDTRDDTPAPAASSGDDNATTPDTPAPEPAPSVDLSALPAPYSTADYDAGRRMFRRCGSCHTVTADGGHRVGPNLHGIFGRTAGSADGFDYSDALESADFEWTPEQLDHWLANPREFLPGNRMSFVGLRDEADRQNVIAYLLVETKAD